MQQVMTWKQALTRSFQLVGLILGIKLIRKSLTNFTEIRSFLREFSQERDKGLALVTFLGTFLLIYLVSSLVLGLIYYLANHVGASLKK
ncbi:hypothetical protein [Vagococcus humatus]|uniref:Uncharacterized protein n=1 Tax=Vagococcus humatus TaxID=1889241 RepID=A0A3S0A507_9ENTE|nr:hypothetical protein [Vagococcus humatus]RST89122.1 hypothetical protein C7P63_07485 [Vagococcus humatus]